MIQVWKRFNGCYDDDYKWLITDPNTKNLNYHQYKLFKKGLVGNKKFKQNSFGFRVVNDWNSLPGSVVDVRTVNEFKAKLDNHWSNLMFLCRQ